MKNKFNSDGSLNKFTARLVAHGFTQEEEIVYREALEPSSRQESLKAFLAVNGHWDWELVQLDVVGGFLYSELDEEIYMTQPQGVINEDYPDHMWQLNLSIYSVKKSAQQWHKCLADQLNKIGFLSRSS